MGVCDDAAESLEGETSERLYKGEEEKKETGAHGENAHAWRTNGEGPVGVDSGGVAALVAISCVPISRTPGNKKKFDATSRH